MEEPKSTGFEGMKIINDFYDQSEFKDAEPSTARNFVFTKSLAVERYMSMFLSFILDIRNYKESKSFGNTSNALAFSQKLNLFTDLGYVEKEYKNKLTTFSEIRNQFAHNAECITFQNAYTVQIVNKLRGWYPDFPGTEQEEYCEKVFEKLYEDIKLLFQNLRTTIYNNRMSEFLWEFDSLIMNHTMQNLQKNPEHFDSELLNKIKVEVMKLVNDKYGLNKETFRANITLKASKFFP